MPHHRVRSGVLALCVFALGGCAAHAPSRNAPQLVALSTLRDREGRPRPCEPSRNPRVLPAADAVVDSAALVGRLASMAEGTAVYSVLFSADDGELMHARRIPGAASDLPAGADDVLAASVRPQEAGRALWGVQLRVTSGARPALQVGRQEYCPYVATPSNRAVGAVSITGEEGKNTFTMAEWASMATPSVRFTITERGEVENPSGDAHKLHALLAFRFEPALIDRIPVSMRVQW